MKKVMVRWQDLEVNTSHGKVAFLSTKHPNLREKTIEDSTITIVPYHDVYIPSSYFLKSKQNPSDNNVLMVSNASASNANMKGVYSLI